jgi:hypothetical protein
MGWERHQYQPPVTGRELRFDQSPRRALVAHTYEGPSPMYGPARWARLESPPVQNSRHPVDDRLPPVDGPVEIEVCRKKSRKTLVGLGLRGIELSLRPPSGERGIGRRR